MTVFTNDRGNRVKTLDGVTWLYEDGSPLDFSRPCVHCGRPPGPEGEDGCLGMRAGVKYACCGHGDVDSAYVITITGDRYDGQQALDLLMSLPRRGQPDGTEDRV